jgi:putative nucleotidyltransferase with HDIG domain
MPRPMAHRGGPSRQTVISTVHRWVSDDFPMNLSLRKPPTHITRTGTFELNDPALAQSLVIEDTLREVVNAPAWAPPTLPRAAMEVIVLSQKPSATFADIERVLAQDPLLVARVLRRGQSPLFAGGSRITSLRDVLVRLGIGGIRDLILEESMRQRIFRAGQYQAIVEATANHGREVAIAAQVVCRYTSISGEYAYLIGLLHDVGISLALAAIVDKLPKTMHPTVDQVGGAIVGIHEEIGALLARRWELPEEVALIIEHHHQLVIGGHAHPLACVLSVAEEMVAHRSASTGCDKPQRLYRFAVDNVGLTESQLKLINRDVEQALLKDGA